jgi:hypothetical protein
MDFLTVIHRHTRTIILTNLLHVNLSFSGPLVLEKIFKWPNPISYICNYLPFNFDEDLALYLNKLEFPSPQDDLYYD